MKQAIDPEISNKKISELSLLKVNDDQEAEIKDKRTDILYDVATFFAFAMISVVAIPILDSKITGGDRPGLITFCGVGLSMTLLVIALFRFGIKTHFSMPRLLFYYALVFNVIIVILKMALAPAVVYLNNPTLYVDEGKSGFLSPGDLSNINGNPIVLFIVTIGLFGMYALVFKLLANPSKNKIATLFNEVSLKKAKIKKSQGLPTGVTVLLIALALFTGGAILFIPFILLSLAMSAPEPIFDWIGYVFSGVGGIAIAGALVAAILFARSAIMQAENQSIALKSLQYFVTFIWLSILLLGTYHILWAVYLFVLTTLWPFKVFTYGVAPK